MSETVAGMSPERIGKYRIDGILGTGAMGVVYRGYDARVGRTVAIKTIRKELLESGQPQEMLDRFRNEARAAGRLSHPNIVTVYEFDEDENTAYLATEYVAGIGLDRWLAQNGRADVDTALRWMFQLLSALDCAHALGVIHRDIKPANLLLAENGQIKLTDFGVARIDSSRLTQSGWLVGTPAYMAPEQLNGEPIDRRADVYSAGVLLFRLLTGRNGPRGRQSANEGLRGTCGTQRDIPVTLAGVLDRALARDPAARYASAGEFLDALRAVHEVSATIEVDDDATRIICPPPAPDVAAAAPAPYPHPEDAVKHSAHGWSRETLQWIETSLAQHVGPIARVLVSKASSNTGMLHELAARLASDIPNEGARTRFLDTLNQLVARLENTETGMTRNRSRAAQHERHPHGTHVSLPVAELDESAFHDIEQRLASCIGAMAKVALRQARRQARSLRELCLALAESVPDLRARARFLRDMGIE